MCNGERYRLWTVVSLACFVLGLGTLAAQDYRAKLQGVVTDSTQAAVIGAKVILHNDNTGVETTRMTSESGRYGFDFVEPGKYTISMEAAGFNKFIEENVVVEVRGDVTVNAVLSVGQVVETVSVSATAAAIQFNTSTMELTVNGKMLSDLPVMARNPFTLALLDPAVVNRYWDVAHRNPFYMWAASEIDVGGSTSTQNDILLDGAPVQIGIKGSYVPPMDAVSEFSVQQNSVDAEFGHSAGGIMSVGMKSGTNDYHGTVYYFGRNPDLNARTDSATNTPNQVRNNIWGFTLGNPIKKNKLFAFTAYEGWRSVEPTYTIRTMPTDLERTGDFSKSLNIYGGLRTIFDPWTTQFNPATGAVVRQPFAGNIIPQSRIDPTAARMMQDIWHPNNPGDDITGVNNYKISYGWPQKYYNVSERADWNITDNWKVFGRFSRVRTLLDTTTYVDSPAMKNDNGGQMNNHSIAGDMVYTLNPTTVLNFRMGFASLQDDYVAPKQAIGESGLAQLWPNNPWYQPYVGQMPAIYYPALSVGGGTYGMGSYWIQHPRHWTWDASIRKTKGMHNMKAGFAYRQHKADGIFPDLMDFNFQQALTAETFNSPDLKRYGSDWATFLLGALDPNSQASTYPYQYFRENFFALFFQDDVKLTRRITLNLGLRYEYETAPFDEQDRFSRYLDLTQPISGLQNSPPQLPAAVTQNRTAAPIYNGAWIFADSSHRQLYNTQQLTLEPRLGVAIRINDKTAFRAGYARYVIPPVLTQNTLASGLPMAGYSQTTTVAPILNGVPQSTLSNPFPSTNPLILPLEKSLGADTNLGNSVSFYDQNMHTGVNDRWNLSVQRELPAQFHLDFTFFMNFGHNLPYTLPLNMADPNICYQIKAQCDATVANPFYQIMTPSTFPGALRNQPTVTVGSLLSPYPQYGTISQLNTNGVLDRYKAAQFRLERRFNQGFAILFTYNYNRERTYNFFNAIDQYNDHLTYLDSNNPRHRFSAAMTYEFPVGRGRQFLGNLHPILNAIIGGWQTSHFFMANSGDFLRFGQMTTDGSTPSVSRSRNDWFDTSLFSIAPPYTPRTNPYQYPGVTGPKYWNLDSTLSKNFPIRERFNLEFRWEVYNALNVFVPTDPNMTVTSSLFGRSTDQMNRGREMQYTLRLRF